MLGVLALPGLTPTTSAGASALTTPAITRVAFSGTTLAPTVTITGSGFGSIPAGTSTCGTGDNYGTSLWLGDTTQSWHAGLVSSPGTDCIGLLVTTYTPTKIVFGLGSWYSTATVLSPGDQYSVTVGATTVTGTVHYRTITASGDLTGDLVGSITFSPPLTNSPSSGTVQYSWSAQVFGVGGSTTQGNGSIYGAAVHAKGTLPVGSNCNTPFVSSDFPAAPISVRYFSTGAYIAPSTVTISSAGANPSQAIYTFDWSASGVHGSFTSPAGNQSQGSIVLDQSVGHIASQCGASGLSSLPFSGLNGVSGFQLGS